MWQSAIVTDSRCRLSNTTSSSFCPNTCHRARVFATEAIVACSVRAREGSKAHLRCVRGSRYQPHEAPMLTLVWVPVSEHSGHCCLYARLLYGCLIVSCLVNNINRIGSLCGHLRLMGFNGPSVSFSQRSCIDRKILQTVPGWQTKELFS